MRVRPISLNAANKWMADVHRVHKRPCAGWLFGVAILADDGAVIGVAMAGRPKARHLQDGTTVEITRVAALPGHPNACSFAYGALRRAAAALGYRRVYTYTLATEPGISPRAAGFVYDGLTTGGEWSSPARPRSAAENSEPKHRWVWIAE